MRTQIKKLEQALANKDADGAHQLLSPTLSIVDKSVQKGLLKKNTASRMKSRLTVLTKTLAAKPAESSSWLHKFTIGYRRTIPGPLPHGRGSEDSANKPLPGQTDDRMVLRERAFQITRTFATKH